MYNLGEHFKRPAAFANVQCIYSGEHYRISILTDRLIRLEYSKSGVFEDRPTMLAWNRNFPVPKFVVKEDKRYIEIKTSYFNLFYIKNKSFEGSKVNPTANLRVEVANSDRVWYYGHPEVRNYGAPSSLITTKKGKNLIQKKEKGLYSIDGFASIDDSTSSVFLESGEVASRENKEIDIYLFVYYKDFPLALKDYYGLTGKPGLIPRYALGNWWSKNEAYDDTRIRKLVTEFNENEIPLSIVLLEKNWHKRYIDGSKELETGFTFNKDLLPDPVSLIKYLNSKGIRVGLNINPSEGLYPIDEIFEKAKTYIVPDEKGKIPLNVYDPKFIDVYLKLYIHPLDNFNVDFYGLDFFDKNKKEALFLLKHYQFLDIMRDYKRRPMVIGYDPGIASHRYPALYSGKSEVSWDSLNSVPLHNSNAANVGSSFWVHDIGGYHKGIEEDELYIRYIQLGVFSPILKLGSERGKYYKREPWKWSIKTFMIVQKYLQLRHKLIPYLYSEAYKYSVEGIPLIQPLYYKFPEVYDDPLFKNEYFFGEELYVSPIIKHKDDVMSRSIHKFYIPEGVWYDITTGKKFPGGQNYVSFFRDQDYPVFARSGAIIPMSFGETLNDTTPPKNMEIHVYPGRNNSYNLYEDDGLSDLYRKGFFLKTNIDYNYLPNNYTVIIRAIDGKSGIVPETRNYRIRFRNTKKPEDVTAYFNNTEIELTSYVEGTDFIVEVNDVKTIGQLTINCKGKDIEIDAVRLINEDIEKILSDLLIDTELKEKVDAVLFSSKPINKKRIDVRKLKRIGLERKFIILFLKLLEYVEQV